jgi:hypothetical protein
MEKTQLSTFGSMVWWVFPVFPVISGLRLGKMPEIMGVALIIEI